MKTISKWCMVASLFLLLGMQACQDRKEARQTELTQDELLRINEKFIPYFSIKDGHYQLDLTMEEASEIGIAPEHYRPVRAMVDTLNAWIEKYHITPEQVERGEKVNVIGETGDTIAVISLVGLDSFPSLRR